MRYKLVPMDNDWLKVEPVEDGPFPVKAEGFLVMDAKKSPNAEMFIEIKNGNVLVWVKRVVGNEFS